MKGGETSNGPLRARQPCPASGAGLSRSVLCALSQLDLFFCQGCPELRLAIGTPALVTTILPLRRLFGATLAQTFHRGAREAWALRSLGSSMAAADDRVAPVITELDAICRRDTVYMIGPEKAVRLAELVRERKPQLVVECGTALGYSGLWIGRELQRLGAGRLISLELDGSRVARAREAFERAGLGEVVEVRQGDARELVREIEGPVDFLFIDCNANYYPCLVSPPPHHRARASRGVTGPRAGARQAGLEQQLSDGAVLVADNVGWNIPGEEYMARVRTFDSGTRQLSALLGPPPRF